MKIILLLLMAVLPVNSQDSRIVFGGVATGRADTKYYGDIYTVDPDGDTTPVPLTKGLITHEPVWSPDGREIAFFRINYTPGEFVVEVHDIGIMNADGSNIREMDRGKRSCGSRRENDDDLSCIRRIEHIRWSPDGSLIVLAAFDIDRFTASVEYALSLFFLYPGKWSWEQRIDILPDVSHRDWIPFGHMDVLPDGRIAYSICCSTDDPGTGLWIANPDGTDPRKIDGFPVGNNFDVSPDGSMIAFTGDDGYWEREDEKDWITEIEIMEIDGELPSKGVEIEKRRP